jgi:hypothetical protein
LKNCLENYHIKEKRTKLRKEISNVNWPIVRDELYYFIDDLLKEYPNVFHDFCVDKTDVDCGDNGFWGFDSLQITQTDRFTGTGEWNTEDGRKKFICHNDYGVNLDIIHSKTGRIHVFVKRKKKCDISNAEHPKLLLYFTDDPLKLTNKRVLGFVKNMLFYDQATSNDRRLTLKDKLRLATIQLRSHIRLKSMTSYIYDLVFNSFFALAGLIITSIALYVAYLTLLATPTG